MKPYFERDGIVIYHGDCREVLSSIQADVIVTDPPYGIGWSRGVNAARASKAHPGIANDKDTSVRDEVLLALQHLPAIVFGSFYAPFPANIKHIMVWQKPPDAGVVGSTTGYRRDVEPIFLVGPWPKHPVRWSSVIPSGHTSMKQVCQETGHPHTKPLRLLRSLIQRCPEGVILDPFMGSGSTLLAAYLEGRRAIGIELEERYCEIAAKRLQQAVLPLEMAAG
jgi:site-specific DNA-methyltransferase (adenine-specific)